MRSSEQGRRAHAVPVVAWLAVPAIALVRRKREHVNQPVSALALDGPVAPEPDEAFTELGFLPPSSRRAG